MSEYECQGTMRLTNDLLNYENFSVSSWTLNRQNSNLLNDIALIL